MRAFIAIEIDSAVRRGLGELAPQIRQSGAVGRPVKTASLHLTLKFLGEIDPSRVPSILQILEESARGFAAFTVETRSLGVFPHLARPRILWAGISPRETISRLRAGVDQGLVQIGLSPEGGEYHPHLTLLRIRALRDRAGFARWVQLHSRTSFGWSEIHEMVLFQSLLKPDGAEYNVLGRVPLGAGPKNGAG